MELDLSGNSLTAEIPSRLGRAAELTKLDLSDNNLSGRIPQELGSLTKLEYLYLQGNNLLSWIPPALGELTMLKELRLGGGNMILGCIAEELREVADSDLDDLYLRYCGTTVLPATGGPAAPTWLSALLALAGAVAAAAGAVLLRGRRFGGAPGPSGPAR